MKEKRNNVEDEFFPEKDEKDYSDELEKGDFLALVIAMASYMIPVVLGMVGIIFLFIFLWLRFYA